MDQYKNEYLSLINDDEDFAAIWKDTEEDFKEWCEVYNIKTEKEQNQIEWVSDSNGVSTWYCNSCDEYIDDDLQEMEIHECKSMEVA